MRWRCKGGSNPRNVSIIRKLLIAMVGKLASAAHRFVPLLAQQSVRLSNSIN